MCSPLGNAQESKAFLTKQVRPIDAEARHKVPRRKGVSLLSVSRCNLSTLIAFNSFFRELDNILSDL